MTTGRSCAILANPHDIIQFSYLEKQALLPEVARLYKKGLSLRDIAKHCDISKTAVRSELLKGGIPLREPTGELKFTNWTKKGKTSSKPPFGFCYFEGQVTKHPKEYPILQLIYKRWNLGANANSIADQLNDKKIHSPMNKEWSWNSVKNIIDRFKNKKIFNKDGKLELFIKNK